MEELMIWIGDKLDSIGNTTFEELERDSQGKVNIDDINLVYNIPNVQNINVVKKQVILEIDIWGRKDQVLDIETVVESIDKSLNNEIVNTGTAVFYISRSIVWINNIKDENKNIRRKKLNYLIRLYKE